MATSNDIKAQIEALQAELANADTDDAIWVKDGDHEVKISGKRATTVLNKFAKLWEVEAEGDQGDGDDSDQGDEKPKTNGYFGRK